MYNINNNPDYNLWTSPYVYYKQYVHTSRFHKSLRRQVHELDQYWMGQNDTIYEETKF